MSDNQNKSVEELNREIIDLKIRLTRLEEYLIHSFNDIDPRDYIDVKEEVEIKDAIRFITQSNIVSTSFLQRKMSIGYARAARLLDTLEEKGLVGPATGAKPREVLLDNIEKYLSDSTKYDAILPPQDADEEKLYNDALKFVSEYQTASASFLQRKMGIGYARAARLLDKMEENGIVGPQNGANPRKILKKN